MYNLPDSLCSMKTFLASLLMMAFCEASFAAKKVTTAYVVKPGDTHASIAKKFGLTEKEFKEAQFERHIKDFTYDPFDLSKAKVLYIDHMDYSEEKELARNKKAAADLDTAKVTQESADQISLQRLDKCEKALGIKISDKDFIAALGRFERESWPRCVVADAQGRKEIYGLLNKCDGKPDYALLFKRAEWRLYRIDEVNDGRKIVTVLDADKKRMVVSIKSFKKTFEDSDCAVIVVCDYIGTDGLYLVSKPRYLQDVEIWDMADTVGNMYFGERTYTWIKTLFPSSVKWRRVALKFSSKETDSIDLGCFYLDDEISRQTLRKPLKAGLQAVVDRNWGRDVSATRPATAPKVTDGEVRYLLDCTGNLTMTMQ